MLASVLLIVSALAQENAGAFSIVKPSELQVHAETSLESPITKTLKQGDRVVIEFEITSEAAWCKVREADLKIAAGYVLCSQIERPQTSLQKSWTVEAPRPTAEPFPAAPEKTTAPKSAAAQLAGLSIHDPEYWAIYFGFSAEQRRKGEDLLRRSGLTACRANTEVTFRNHGIHSSGSFLDALAKMAQTVAGMQEMGRISAELERCGVLYQSFWKRFVEILDTGQRQLFVKNVWLMLFFGTVLSDPATLFATDVLSRMKKP